MSVSRRAVSSQSDSSNGTNYSHSSGNSTVTTLPSWRPPVSQNISDNTLYPYLVKLAVLNYRTEPRFRGFFQRKPKNNESPERSIPLGYHSRHGSSQDLKLTPLTSPGNYLNPGSSTASLKSKMPKELLKAVQARFNEMAMNADKHNIDPLLRRSYLSLYAVLLSPDSYKQLKESKRAEDLVMRFLSCSAKELQKSGLPPSQISQTLDSQAASFVQLLIQCIKDLGLANSHSGLLKQLESYKESLLSRGVLAPEKSTPSGGGGGGGGEVPTFQISDMSFAQEVVSLVNVSEQEVQLFIDRIKNEATDTRAISELKHIQHELKQYNRHLVYHRIDFEEEEQFKDWKSLEIESIDQVIGQTGNPNAEYISASTEDIYFIPSDPRSFYRHLLKRCLERDLKTASDELIRNSEVVTLILSKKSLDLLNHAARLWRVPRVSTSILLIDSAYELLQENQMGFNEISHVFNLMRHILQKETWDPNKWCYTDKLHYISLLSKYQEYVITQIANALAQIYEPSPVKIGPYLEFLDEYIFSEAIGGFPSLQPSEKQLKQLKHSIIAASEKKYDKLIDEIPRDHTLDPLHIIDLADKLIAIAKKVQKRYKFALFDQLSINHISAERHLVLFSADSQSMFNHMTTHIETNHDWSFEDMMSLYRKMTEIRDLYVQVSKLAFGFDLEKSFYPYVVKWVESSSALAQSWVDPAIKGDNFEPLDKDAETMYSSSVKDIFAAFQGALGVVSDLNWRNKVQVANIYTILMKGISGAICLYCNGLLGLFIDELREKDQNGLVATKRVATRQDKWLALAKSAMSGRENVVPFTFLSATCIKLNDIEQAQIELDSIESELDSEKLSKLIEQTSRSPRKKQSAQSYLFSVRIVQAEGLKACDMNGLSDPYVTLVDQKTCKQIGKTITIYEELNPRWDETFDVTVSGGPKWLAVTVWDENTLTNHDVCGRAFIRLDPSAFEDFVSQDIWLDLDTQGRLLVTLNMESERDDIRFQFGKAFRMLSRTENDMIRMIVDKFTAFIRYSISLHTLKSLVGTNRFGIEAMSNWLSSTKISGISAGKIPNGISNKPGSGRLSQTDIEDSLNPLFDYLNENFSTLAQQLTTTMRLKVMTKTWKVVLTSIESLLLPTLNNRRTTQQQLSAAEADIVFTWLSAMRDFFHHDGAGPSLEILQSSKYQELMTIPVYYDLSTSELKAESEKMSSQSFKGLQDRVYCAIPEMIKRKNTVMAHRNRKVLKQQEEELNNAKRDSIQTEDIILRILKLRGEFDYVARRLKQRERIAQTIATERLINTSGFRKANA